MSIVARNLKAIRKALQCSQSAMAEILNVGFRAYARYESGEREAPASVVVKMSQLGKVPAQTLLARGMGGGKAGHGLTGASSGLPAIAECDPVKGRIVFKGPASRRRLALLTVNDRERRALILFRRMDAKARAECLAGLAGKKSPVRSRK